jgi:hypothetical protein
MNKDCKRILKIGGGLVIALVIFVSLRSNIRENYEIKKK